MIKCKRSDLKSFLLKINEKGKIKLNKSGVNEFITIKNNVETEIVEKKSKFIANLFYIENSEQAEKMIKETKKLFIRVLGNYDITHYFIVDELNPDLWGFDEISMTERNKMETK